MTARRTATTRVVTEINRTAILDALREKGPLTRRGIQSATGLSPATVERLCVALANDRLIVPDGRERSSGGRPSVLYRHAGDSRVVAAVEIAAARVRGRLVDLDGHVVHACDVGHDCEDADSSGVTSLGVPATLTVIEQLLGHADRIHKPCVAIGVSVPGAVSAPEGRVTNAAELGWRDVPLGDILRARHDTPVVIENDANAIGFGEWSDGVGENTDSLAALVLGYGVGAGIVNRGVVLRGHRSGAGEIGYLVADRGALSRLFTVQGDLESRIHVAMGGRPVGETLRRAAAGEEDAVHVAEAVFDYLGLACVALSAVVDPEVIVLAGHLVEVRDYAIDQVRRRLVGRVGYPPRVVVARFGQDAALEGVARLAISRAVTATYLS